MGAKKAGEGFAIGTVAGLTGVDVHTIRAWERRYAAIQPERTRTGHRRYGETQIRRLHLLRAATELGEPIRSLADLDDDALRERLEQMTAPATSRADAHRRVAIVGQRLVGQLEAVGNRTSGWRVVAALSELEQLADAEPAPDLVVLHADRLPPSLIARIDAARDALPDAEWLVVYEFAPRSELLALARRRIRTVRGPLRIDALERTVNDLSLVADSRARPPEAPRPVSVSPERRFDDAQLANLREIVGTVACECPSHLASIVSSLVSFEEYTWDCENASELDAALHRQLAHATARARQEMERMLEHICAHDGIRI